MKNEFNFIKSKLKPLSFNNKEARGLSDDCATFNNLNDLVISVDSSVEGVHLPIGTDIGIQSRRAILRALSDLATFGSSPVCIFAAMTLPKSFQEPDFDRIAEGYRKALIEYDIFLAGGDITSHDGLPIFSITVLGDNGNIGLGRNKAREGDLIVVSGSIGDSFIGLNLLINDDLQTNSLVDNNLVNKFLIPNPQIELGKNIKMFATSIIDISDGLISEIKHLCENSKVGADINIIDIPISLDAKKYIDSNIFNYTDLITGGDDYELLYTIDPKDEKLIDENSSIIGKIVSGNKINLYSKDKNLIDVNKIILGYKHF
ncbi:MAG: thiamine-phosphate kinase [Alphaproteobacteria bacterium]